MPGRHANSSTFATNMTNSDVVPTLSTLRLEIDGIDDALHDLLMRRAGVVQRVAELGRAGKIPFRPGREANILARLLARHGGPLPRHAVVRWWREMFAAHISIETAFTIAVCDPGGTGPYAAAAREHFGALTALRVHPSPAQALGDVSRGLATAAVLPMPVEEEPSQAAWWVALLHRDEPRIHVVGRLPFWAPRPEGSPTVQALVVAAAAPDPSLNDRTLIGFEVLASSSRTRVAAALAGAGMEAAGVLLRRDGSGGVSHGLIDVAGHVGDGDPRLAALARAVDRAVVLGSYAAPVGGP